MIIYPVTVPVPVVIILVLSIKVLLECPMLTIEGPRLGIQSLVALLVLLVELIMDPPMLPPVVMHEGQGSRPQ